MNKRFNSLSEFYPFYLSQHENLTCRQLHFISTSAVIACWLMFLHSCNAVWIPTSFVLGYGLSWMGHFFFEKNKPATFTYPFYSFVSDFIMYKDIWLGKLKIW